MKRTRYFLLIAALGLALTACPNSDSTARKSVTITFGEDGKVEKVVGADGKPLKATCRVTDDQYKQLLPHTPYDGRNRPQPDAKDPNLSNLKECKSFAPGSVANEVAVYATKRSPLCLNVVLGGIYRVRVSGWMFPRRELSSRSTSSSHLAWVERSGSP